MLGSDEFDLSWLATCIHRLDLNLSLLLLHICVGVVLEFALKLLIVKCLFDESRFLVRLSDRVRILRSANVCGKIEVDSLMVLGFRGSQIVLESDALLLTLLLDLHIEGVAMGLHLVSRRHNGLGRGFLATFVLV